MFKETENDGCGGRRVAVEEDRDAVRESKRERERG